MPTTVTQFGKVDWVAHGSRYAQYLRWSLSPAAERTWDKLATILDCPYAGEDLPTYKQPTFFYEPEEPCALDLLCKPVRLEISQKFLLVTITLENGEIVGIRGMKARRRGHYDHLIWLLLRHVCSLYYPKTTEVSG